HGTIESRGEHFATAARDLSEGGLSQAVVEAAVQSGVGIEISLDDVSADPFVALFSESASRALVAVREGDTAELEARAAEVGVPFAKIGRVLTGDDEKVIRVSGGEVSFEIPVAEAESAWRDTLPNLFAHAVGANSVVEAE
ncbi:MAG TPA: phosphoribosylformylglycinamidine synthase subunit PurL, partial [Corynebacterium sp.]|uniref:AIR synthase-related protein n=1 Tax=Corynebacterium sp. TaxID=1720 RepID=UPI001832128B